MHIHSGFYPTASATQRFAPQRRTLSVASRPNITPRAHFGNDIANWAVERAFDMPGIGWVLGISVIIAVGLMGFSGVFGNKNNPKK